MGKGTHTYAANKALKGSRCVRVEFTGSVRNSYGKLVIAFWVTADAQKRQQLLGFVS